MSSGVAIKSQAVGAPPFRNTRTKVFTPYPYSHSFDSGGDPREILPYMARLHSPVRVTFTPGPSSKMKSRVSDQARASVFNFRPLDKPATPIRFKPPDATLPTVDYMSPWVSVTKLDYKDPLNSEYSYGDSKGTFTPIVFRRSQTDSEIQSRIGTALSQGRTDTSGTSTKLTRLQSGSQITSRPGSRSGLEVSIKSGSTEKRVTIVDPSESLVDMDTTELQPKPFVTSREASPKARIKTLKMPDCAVNYYSGYLPPELSDKIASELNISTEDIIDSVSEKKDSNISMFRGGPNYKPLIGDRQLFMRESYPVLPRTHYSDIEKLRFEGRERLLQSNGQSTDHFSALKDRGAQVRPMNRGVRFDEALRKQQRLAKSATISRQPRQQTSIDLYQQQKERTYNLQNLAREMINK